MATSFTLADDATYFAFLNKENVSPGVWDLLNRIHANAGRDNVDWVSESDFYWQVKTGDRREAIEHGMVLVDAQPRPLEPSPDSPMIMTRVYKLTLKGLWFVHILNKYGPK